ncbi:alpha/beta hydrolase [Rhodococcus sp. IEGM 1366]|uniref:alpha/beta hydrolase n=1 Tax=Rhodococcus sp. IEGM 1366 TaxID=3082223 RepID=UPI00295339D1|nr:alpha/beta hydrolase [Rhodococcus sp. IEGM 1366]MDV8071430.1 alpha/beta hydrolase [Rhodococcus sp. IEGM 1366]
MNRQHTRTAAVAAAATCLLLAACSAPPTSSQPEISVPQQSSVSEMEWSACPDGVENPADGPARLQCASVPVPVDPDDPDGRQIDIMISRLPSQKPEQRRGVLLLNPGGPGGTGLDQPRFLADRGIPQSVLDSYDLIGMDTRGVGHSSPISCGFTDDLHYYGAVPPYAYDQAAFDEQVRTAKEVARRCAADDDGMLRHVSTANMARDLDRIRAALGEDTASFLGYSYGSALGAAYASMFPDSTDRIVLDSNIGDTHLDRDGMRRYARGMEDTFPDFARWVAERHDRYGLGATEEQVRANYFAIASGLDATPVDGVDGRSFRLVTFVTLYNPASYETTADAWVSYRDGLAAGVGGDLPVGAPVLSAGDNAWSVFLAVTCNDVEWPHEVSTYEQAVAADRVAYPLFGAAAANIMPCAFWESVPAEPPVTIDTEGPTNILIAQHRRDPVTPVRGGELLDERFGQRSRLLTVDGSGHGVFGLGTNPCAQRVVTEYLVDGAMPEEDTTCPVGP